MSGAPTQGADESRAARRRRARAVWYIVGVALLALAVWAVWRQQGLVGQAISSIRAAPAGMVAGIALLPIANWLLTSGVFWLLTRRLGAVGAVEMSALVGAAWLYNLLPMRPGLLGRVAYHKAVHGIAVRDSAKVLLQVIAVTAMVSCMLAVVCVAIAAIGATGWLGEPLMVGTAVVLGLLPPCMMLALGSQPRRGEDPAAAQRLTAMRALMLAGAMRYLEMMVWAARYWLVFEAIDHPVALWQLGVIVVASQVAGLLPVQLGVREWIVGVMTAAGGLLGIGGAALPGMTQGLLADLINRAAEIVCSVPIGLASTAWLAARRARADRGKTAAGTGGERQVQ
ncbi:MAG: hypothetical protein JNJ48_00995 [Phycisphaerae bacterium]|nr:hypothetical protein [Phycisphaerae bacterium]